MTTSNITEKTCPECAETVKAAARVCRYCGYRFDSKDVRNRESDTILLASNRPNERVGMVMWAGVSLALMLVGSFGPWVKALGISVSGTDGGNDGWAVIVVGVIVALLVYGGRRVRNGGWSALIGGIGGAAITIHDRSHLSAAINQGGSFTRALVQVGWGLNAAMIGSISLAICGVLWLLTWTSADLDDELPEPPAASE
ncbi:MAG: zinc ribbon domain-containing protein [Actinomycetota bacterium]